jgi:hypothetical protein
MHTLFLSDSASARSHTNARWGSMFSLAWLVAACVVVASNGDRLQTAYACASMLSKECVAQQQ